MILGISTASSPPSPSLFHLVVSSVVVPQMVDKHQTSLLSVNRRRIIRITKSS